MQILLRRLAGTTIASMLVLPLLTSPAQAVAPKEAIASSASVQKVKPDEFDKVRQESNVVVIDVRSPEEYAAGRVPGAINIPVTGKGAEAFDKEIVRATKEKKALVYCRSGSRSAKAVEKMQSLGVATIVEMPGGWVAWTQAEKPTEKGPSTKPAN